MLRALITAMCRELMLQGAIAYVPLRCCLKVYARALIRAACREILLQGARWGRPGCTACR